MIEFIRRKNLFKILSDDRRTLANALVKVSESKLDMSGTFFKRRPSYRGNKNPMLVPQHTCGRDTRESKPKQKRLSTVADYFQDIQKNENPGRRSSHIVEKEGNFLPQGCYNPHHKSNPMLGLPPVSKCVGFIGKEQKDHSLVQLSEPCHCTVLLGRAVIPIATQRNRRESARENALSKRTSSPVNKVRFNSASCWIWRLGSQDLAF